jgi:hypothetical protein
LPLSLLLASTDDNGRAPRMVPDHADELSEM